MKMEYLKKPVIITLLGFLTVFFFGALLAIDKNLVTMEYGGSGFEDGWTMDGEQIELPIEKGEFTITNTMPDVDDLESLIMRIRYKSVQVYVDNELIYESGAETFLGRTTTAGNKMIIVPLKNDYSGKTITIEATLLSSYYSDTLSEITIANVNDYIIHLIRLNLYTIMLSLVFATYGMLEAALSLFFLIRDGMLRKKSNFLALLYGGLASLCISAWAMDNTRIPGLVTGNLLMSSIIGYLFFLMIPITFSKMVEAMAGGQNKLLNFISIVCTVVVLKDMLLISMEVIDWIHAMYSAHILDFICIVATTASIVYEAKKNRQDKETRIGYVGVILFLSISAVALVRYTLNRETGYMSIFLLGVLCYMSSQIIIIFSRIGIRAEEENDYMLAKEYAYKDELTGLGNRRKYWETIKEYEGKQVSEDFTVICMDVNRLKYYNDTNGHEAGDRLLKKTADCLKETFPDALAVCRMGGDEFAVVGIMDEDKLEEELELFKVTVERAREELGMELSVAVGSVSRRKYPYIPLAQFSRLADDEMYGDKQAYYKKSGIDRRRRN